jgi:hypothetical protein
MLAMHDHEVVVKKLDPGGKARLSQLKISILGWGFQNLQMDTRSDLPSNCDKCLLMLFLSSVVLPLNQMFFPNEMFFDGMASRQQRTKRPTSVSRSSATLPPQI